MKIISLFIFIVQLETILSEMPRCTYLSDFEKGKISVYLNNGLSFREIRRRTKSQILP